MNMSMCPGAHVHDYSNAGFLKVSLFISNIIIWEFIRNANSLVTSQTLLSWKLWKRGLAMGFD